VEARVEALVTAGRRFALILLVILAAVTLLSAAVGALLGADLQRAVSLGYYCVGSFLLVAGFFMGIHGPVRLRGEPGDEGPWGLGRKKGVRWASAEEHKESTASAGLFIFLGLVVVALGVVVDDRYRLF
jgi:hypothetical protein